MEASRLVLDSNDVVERVGRREEDRDGERSSSRSVGRWSSLFGEVKVEEGGVGDGEGGGVGRLDELEEEVVVLASRVRWIERRRVQLGRSSDDVRGSSEGSRGLDDAEVIYVSEAFRRDLERLDLDDLLLPTELLTPRPSPPRLNHSRREKAVEDADLLDPSPSSSTLRTIVEKATFGVEEEVPCEVKNGSRKEDASVASER